METKDLDNLKKIVEINIDLQNQNAKLCQKVEELSRQVEWLNRQLFGAKSEKIMPPNLSPLLPGFADKKEEEKQDEKEAISKKEPLRKKRKKNGWNEIPDGLPCEEKIIDVPEKDRKGKVLIGYEISKRYARRETRFYIIVIKRAKYANPNDSTQGVITAPPAGDVIDSISGKTKYDISFIVGIIIDKLENYLPIYRQAEAMRREGVLINRSTLLSLFLNSAVPFEVLYKRLNEIINQCDIIHGDETPVKMLQPGKGKCKQAYMWVKMTGIGPPLISFTFANSRSQKVANELYKDYYGTIIHDHYVGYDHLAAGFAGCWAHVRRKFFDILKNGYSDAQKFINLIRNLYDIERAAKKRADLVNLESALFKERKKRRKISIQIVKEFFNQCIDTLTKEIPTSPLAKAINYALNQRSALEMFLKDSRLNIDNNPAENIIRPIVLGRKNWLFAGNEIGGQKLAMFASFAATCKKNNINFRKWLEDTLTKLSSTPMSEIDSLLPLPKKEEIINCV